jgi:hypothetical protein
MGDVTKATLCFRLDLLEDRNLTRVPAGSGLRPTLTVMDGDTRRPFCCESIRIPLIPINHNNTFIIKGLGSRVSAALHFALQNTYNMAEPALLMPSSPCLMTIR